MNEKALEICRKHHYKLLVYYNARTREGLGMGEINELNEAHLHQFGTAFSTCCDGPIKNGLNNIVSHYVKYLKDNGKL